MPFTEDILKRHFAEIRQNGGCRSTADRHIVGLLGSIKRYKARPAALDKKGTPLVATKHVCQIEKDERFWTASCLMTVYYARNCRHQLGRLLELAYGAKPPIAGMNSWKECLTGKLHLFFEANLPSPPQYSAWLRANLKGHQFIPFILRSDNRRKRLEGPTNVDALILNQDNGFAVVIEAKVLSDISYQTTYDAFRNQIARNIDVMLDKNESLCHPLNTRDPEKTLFMLLTPQRFKVQPGSRLYGSRMAEYKSKPETLQAEIPHRLNINWKAVSKRLGWLTWEDFRKVNRKCCPWLK